MGMNEIICEGKIVGNIQCERLILTNGAQAFGNVSVRKLLLEEGAVHVGMMNCHKDAPKILQERISEKVENCGKYQDIAGRPSSHL